MSKLIHNYYKIFIWPPIVFILHSIATLTGVYWKITWLDIPMHFLGGASIALMIYFAIKKFSPQQTWVTIALMIGWTTVVAVGWEWFEFITDHYFGTITQLGLFDSLKDIYCGIVGATAIVIITLLWKSPKK